jgi:hypothetical protein
MLNQPSIQNLFVGYFYDTALSPDADKKKRRALPSDGLATMHNAHDSKVSLVREMHTVT